MIELKEKKLSRKERANKLIKYGLIIEYLGLEDIDEKIVLGYLFNFEKDKIKILEEEENITFNLKQYDKLIIRNLSYCEKKRRNSFLIKRGALFEISKTFTSYGKLIDYLNKLRKESPKHLELYKKEGEHYFKREEM